MRKKILALLLALAAVSNMAAAMPGAYAQEQGPVIPIINEDNGSNTSINTNTETNKVTQQQNVQQLTASEGTYRIFGKNRFETAYGVAEKLKEKTGKAKFDNIIIASGMDYADALSASYLAAKKNAPILLTDKSETARLKNYVFANAAQGATIYLIGGTAAVGSDVESALAGLKVKRLSGLNRYTTNLAVLKEAGVTNEEILIASGLNYADALSASAVGKPILLTAPWGISDEQKAFLNSISSKSAALIGGTGAVTTNVENAAKSYFTSIIRLGGSDRYETSANVAARYFADPERLMLAYGLNYPDGICAGPLAAAYKAPIVLAASKATNRAKTYAMNSATDKATTLGGPALISDEAVKAIISTKISATASGNAMTLKWSAVPGAAKYEIYNDTWATRTRVTETTGTSYTINGGAGVSYKFDVKALDASGNVIADAPEMFVIISTAPAQVSGISYTDVTSRSAKITWAKTNCTYYDVYRKAPGGDFVKIANTSLNYYNDSTLKGQTTYEYKVRAMLDDDTGVTKAGAFSAAVKLTTPVEAVTVTDVASTFNSLTVKWNSLGASRYDVSIKKNGSWVTYSTTNPYYTFSGLQRATSYDISIVARFANGTSTAAASCIGSTDSTVKSRSAFSIYASPSDSSAVLYSGSAYQVLTCKGKYSSSWYRVYIPGSNNTKFGYVKASQMGRYINLGFEPINQLGWEGGAPLPTGCETTAMATLLSRFLGLPCTKNLLADKFLTIVNYWTGDPNYASWGSPYDENAYGVMAPALAEAANRFLKSIGVRDQYQMDVHTDNDANMTWSKLDTGAITHTSGLTLDQIKSELDKGHALCIWWFTRGNDPTSYTNFTINRGERYTHDGTGTYTFTWISTQHGSVISGYDETTNEFIIADVGWGYTVRHSIDHFMKIYTIKGRQSIAIYKK